MNVVDSLILQRELKTLVDNCLSGNIPLDVLLDKVHYAINPTDSDLGTAVPNPYCIVRAIIHFLTNDGVELFSLDFKSLINIKFNYELRHPYTGKTIFHYYPDLLFEYLKNGNINYTQFSKFKVLRDFYNNIPYNENVHKKVLSL